MHSSSSLLAPTMPCSSISSQSRFHVHWTPVVCLPVKDLLLWFLFHVYFYVLFITSKTKEIVVASCRSGPVLLPVSIEVVDVGVVSIYMYLGLVWTENMDMLYRKGQSHAYFLRWLGFFTICRKLLQMFYRSMFASVLFCAVVCWEGSM